MPYITFSRKLPHGVSTGRASKHLSSLFDNCIIERRGAKSIKKAISTAQAKGFNSVVIISESKAEKALRLDVLSTNARTKSFKWSDTYIIKLSGKSNKILNDDGDEATEEFVRKASD